MHNAQIVIGDTICISIPFDPMERKKNLINNTKTENQPKY